MRVPVVSVSNTTKPLLTSSVPNLNSGQEMNCTLYTVGTFPGVQQNTTMYKKNTCNLTLVSSISTILF